MGLSVEPVDIEQPRWVVREPTYLVQFWEKLSDPEPPVVPFWSCYSVRLRGVRDIEEAISWAETNAANREIALYAEVDRGDQHGDVLLRGWDPTWGPASGPIQA